MSLSDSILAYIRATKRQPTIAETAEAIGIAASTAGRCLRLLERRGQLKSYRLYMGRQALKPVHFWVEPADLPRRPVHTPITQAVLAAMDDGAETAQEVARATSYAERTVQLAIQRLYRDGKIDRIRRGHYEVARAAPPMTERVRVCLEGAARPLRAHEAAVRAGAPDGVGMVEAALRRLCREGIARRVGVGLYERVWR